ncbi:MAG TPA: cyclic nucleotide-binding domain-containing protein [Rhodocyclaceae bacterium]|nr:cyclic nucleotide-binding domain-containing protein [Rhodocyclaceae bacterium]
MTWVREEFAFQDLQRLLFKLAERVKAFQGLKPAEIAEVLAHAEKCTFAPGAIIVREGSVGAHMYIIIAGEAKVLKAGRDGEVELARLEAADSFGEMALTDREARSATVCAISDCVLVRISDQAFSAKPEIGMKIYRNIARVLAERLRTADELLAWRL